MSIPEGPPIDVSVPIRPRMPIYAGHPGVAIELVRSIERGDEVNVSRLELGAHTGTHVDAPRHVIAEASGVDELALDRYIGPCVVVDAAAATGLDQRRSDRLARASRGAAIGCC